MSEILEQCRTCVHGGVEKGAAGVLCHHTWHPGWVGGTGSPKHCDDYIQRIGDFPAKGLKCAGCGTELDEGFVSDPDEAYCPSCFMPSDKDDVVDRLLRNHPQPCHPSPKTPPKKTHKFVWSRTWQLESGNIPVVSKKEAEDWISKVEAKLAAAETEWTDYLRECGEVHSRDALRIASLEKELEGEKRVYKLLLEAGDKGSDRIAELEAVVQKKYGQIEAQAGNIRELIKQRDAERAKLAAAVEMTWKWEGVVKRNRGNIETGEIYEEVPVVEKAEAEAKLSGQAAAEHLCNERLRSRQKVEQDADTAYTRIAALEAKLAGTEAFAVAEHGCDDCGKLQDLQAKLAAAERNTLMRVDTITTGADQRIAALEKEKETVKVINTQLLKQQKEMEAKLAAAEADAQLDDANQDARIVALEAKLTAAETRGGCLCLHCEYSQRGNPDCECKQSHRRIASLEKELAAAEKDHRYNMNGMKAALHTVVGERDELVAKLAAVEAVCPADGQGPCEAIERFASLDGTVAILRQRLQSSEAEVRRLKGDMGTAYHLLDKARYQASDDNISDAMTILWNDNKPSGDGTGVDRAHDKPVESSEATAMARPAPETPEGKPTYAELEAKLAAAGQRHPDASYDCPCDRIAALEAESERAQAACHKEHLEKVALEAEVRWLTGIIEVAKEAVHRGWNPIWELEYDEPSGDGIGGDKVGGPQREKSLLDPNGAVAVSPAPETPEGTELIAWCEEHGRETVNKVIFGSFDSYSSGFTLFFKCGRKNWFKFPFLLDPVFTRPPKSSGDEHAGAGHGAQGNPVTPLSPDLVLGLETPASIPPEGEFVCDQCDKHMDTIAVQLDFGFGSTRDDERFIFCSDECFTKWVHEQFDSPTMTGAPAEVHCPNCQTECHPMSTPDWDKINKVWVTEYRCKNCRKMFGMHTKPTG